MKETNEKVYRCDHCNKVMIRKGLMTIHERMCKKNPKNMHKCFDYCTHLVKEVDKEDEHYGDEAYDRPFITFHCDLNPNTPLYSFKLERYSSNKHRCEKMTRMPLECDLFTPDHEELTTINDFFTDEYYLD